MAHHKLRSSLLLLAPLLLAGCGDTSTYDDAPADQRPPVRAGDKVIVEFRREALGATYQVPAPLHATKIETADYALRGEVVETRPGWILLKQAADESGKSMESRIPMSVVLMIDKQ